MPTVAVSGWSPGVTPPGDWPFDAILLKGDVSIRVQIKLQRLERGLPKRYYPTHYNEELFVVEVQKTRSGQRLMGQAKIHGQEAVATRPYRFGDFDIPAVNMHPATHQWNNFRYPVANWLLPRTADASLIEIFQPVSLEPNEVWTNDLNECIDWLLSDNQKRVLVLRRKMHPRRVQDKS